MLPKKLYIFTVILIVLLSTIQFSQCGPLPKVNEQQFHVSKIPQYHCLRYFKHDYLMMRRCRHLHVPSEPRLSKVGNKN